MHILTGMSVYTRDLLWITTYFLQDGIDPVNMWLWGVFAFRHSKYCHSVFQNRRCCLRLQLRSAGPRLLQNYSTLQEISVVFLIWLFNSTSNTHFSQTDWNDLSAGFVISVQVIPILCHSLDTEWVMCQLKLILTWVNIPASVSQALNIANEWYYHIWSQMKR